VSEEDALKELAEIVGRPLTKADILAMSGEEFGALVRRLFAHMLTYIPAFAENAEALNELAKH
jgi:hypothetical protein